MQPGAPIDQPATVASQVGPDWRPGRGLVVAVDHVGLAVADLDAAIDLHTRVFGWRVVHTETNPDQHVTEAMLVAGDGSGTQLQLLAPLDDDSPIAKFLDRRGPGLQQLAYRVHDVAAAGAALRSLGLRVLYDEPRRGTADTLINFVHPGDTGGVLIELVQPADLPEPKNSSQDRPIPDNRLGQPPSPLNLGPAEDRKDHP